MTVVDFVVESFKTGKVPTIVEGKKLSIEDRALLSRVNAIEMLFSVCYTSTDAIE
jgi:hypothetical protein